MDAQATALQGAAEEVTDMNRMQEQVREFHEATGATIGELPKIRDGNLRYSLIAEELQEFADAIGCGGLYPEPEPNLLQAIDALCDLLYVTFGAAVTFGIDIEPFFDAVHKSNMTKQGGPVREDGKRLKPDTYEPPDLEPILKAQKASAIARAATQVFYRQTATKCLDFGTFGSSCIENDGTGLWCEVCLARGSA